jgi:tetratricopeptide (TPR) repeat protein
LNNIKHIIAITLFGLYLFISLPTVLWGDGGFLIAASYSLGIPHPTGHPLFSILAKLSSFIPLGNIAFRMNIFGAFLNVFCFYFIYDLTLTIIRSSDITLIQTDRTKRLISLFAAASFAVSPMILFQARAVETYPLNLFLSLSVIWLIIKINSIEPGEQRKESYLFYTSFFICGIAWGNHSLLILGLLLPVFAIFITSLKRGSFSADLIKALFFFILGLSIYFYLPVRAAANPVVNHGNPDNYQKFLWVVTGEQFRENTFSVGGFFESLNLQSAIFAAKETFLTLYRNITLAWLALGLLGLYFVAKKSRAIGAFLFSAILIQIAITIPPTVTIGRSLEERGIVGYYLVAFALIFILGGAGLYCLADFLNERLKIGSRKSATRLLLAAVCLATIGGFAKSSSKEFLTRDDDYSALVYGGAIMNSIDWNGTFLTVSDAALYVSSYLQACEEARPDLTVINRSILFNDQGFSIFKSNDSPYSKLAGSFHVRSFTDREYEKYLELLGRFGPVYLEPGSSFMPSAFRLYPNYMVFRYGEENDIFDKAWHLKHTDRLRLVLANEENLKNTESAVDFAILEYNFGNYFLKKKDYLSAENHFDFALELSPSMNEALANLLYIYYEAGKYAEAIALGTANILNLKTSAAYYNFALSLVKMGRREEALNILAFALKNQNNPTLRKLFDSMGR